MPLYSREMVPAGFNPLQMINTNPEAIIETSNNSKNI